MVDVVYQFLVKLPNAQVYKPRHTTFTNCGFINPRMTVVQRDIANKTIVLTVTGDHGSKLDIVKLCRDRPKWEILDVMRTETDRFMGTPGVVTHAVHPTPPVAPPVTLPMLVIDDQDEAEPADEASAVPAPEPAPAPVAPPPSPSEIRRREIAAMVSTYDRRR